METPESRQPTNRQPLPTLSVTRIRVNQDGKDINTLDEILLLMIQIQKRIYVPASPQIMTEFKIPPVVFPSATTVYRRAPIIQFQPSDFRSSDVSVLYGGPTSTTTTDALFSEEPSLLEELEIDPTLIYQKTLSLLNPIKFDPSTQNPPDLSGPFLYYISFCIIQLLSGKVQFGVVLGWITLCSILSYFLIHMLEGKYCNLDLYKSFSIVGYSFLPILFLSAITLFVPPTATAARLIMAAVFVLWSTLVSARVFTNGNELFGFLLIPVS